LVNKLIGDRWAQYENLAVLGYADKTMISGFSVFKDKDGVRRFIDTYKQVGV
jgi:hypothetical protein